MMGYGHMFGGSMMGGGGLIWLLVVIGLGLAVAAPVKLLRQ